MWPMKKVTIGLQYKIALMSYVLVTLGIVIVSVANMSTNSNGQYVNYVSAVSYNLKTTSLNGSNKWSRGKSSEPSSPSRSLLENIRTVCYRHNVTCKDTHEYTYKDVHRGYHNFLVDDVHKIIYCCMPKVASTSIKALLFKGTGNSIDKIKQSEFHSAATIIRMGLKFLKNFDEQGRQYRLQNYFKFMAVRHPFDRLVSVYKEKFVQKDWSRFYCPLWKRRTNGSQVDCPYTRNSINKITFTMFADLVASGIKNDHHWRIYSECKPCCIKYDHIVKLETLGDDIVPIVNRLFPDHNNMSTMEHRHRTTEHRTHANETARMFSDVPKAIVNVLLAKYRLDSEMFEYTLEE